MLHLQKTRIAHFEEDNLKISQSIRHQEWLLSHEILGEKFQNCLSHTICKLVRDLFVESIMYIV